MQTDPKPRHVHRARAEATVEVPVGLEEEVDSPVVFEAVRLTGVMAARRSGEFLPDTAAAELTDVDIDCEMREGAVEISSFVRGVSRADLGSRALVAVNAAATALVDRFSESADGFRLEGAQIVGLGGGLQGLDYDFDPPVRAAVLVVSDAVASGNKEDRAGRIVREAVDELGACGVHHERGDVVGDEPEAIESRIAEWCAEGVDLIVTVGGTGLTHTDATVETVEPMIERSIPGLMEAVRDYGQEQTPLAFMSRGVAGLIGDTLVVTLPGSTGGAREATQAVFPAVLHTFVTLRKSREKLLGEQE